VNYILIHSDDETKTQKLTFEQYYKIPEGLDDANL
jgi:hypothetical protein